MQYKNQINDYINNGRLDLERIVKEYTPYVQTIVENGTGNNLSYEDKEEIITDVFLVLWKNQNKVFSAISAYLAGITRNLIKEKLHKKQITYDISEFENVIELSNINLFENEREEIERIEKSFTNLSKSDYEIMTMFYYSSKTIKDIAKELKLSEINVKTRLFRIRKKIKKELGVGE